ncbi:MAG: hypothetical protein ACRYF8_21805 [Janthinobacterium lividum]|jgi:hypothetical protein
MKSTGYQNFYLSSTPVGRSARRAGEGFFQRFPSTPLRRMLLGSIDIARLKNKVSINEQSYWCGFWLVIA